MKNAKVLKPLLLSAAAIMLVVATMFATMAYLVSSAAVSNVFTVGNVSLLMYETKVNPDGSVAQPVSEGAMKTADTNSYHLQPAVTYKKDPTVYVAADSDESYLFIRLRNDLKSVEAPNGKTIVEQLRTNGWLEIERADNNVDAIFVYVGAAQKDSEGKDTTLAALYNAAAAEVNIPENAGMKHSERTKAILAKLADIKAKPVGKTQNADFSLVKDAEGRKYQAIDVFQKFSIDKDANLEAFGGARVAIVAYAIQANGIGAADAAFSQASYKLAWTLLQEKLPYSGVTGTN